MNTDNGNLNFEAGIDTSQFDKDAKRIEQELNQVGKTAEEKGKNIDQAFSNAASNIGKAFAAITATTAIAGLGKKIMSVRGEFQQLEIAFGTMLGSAKEANILMSQLVKTAATTPFDLQSVANGAKQLLAYGTEAKDVNATLIKLGDIASGLSIPLNDLVYLYGTTMTQGRMFTQDLRQFQGRGIPLAEELAKILDTTKDKVGDFVTAGKVTSEVFKQAIDNMTKEGSKFGGLMEAQSKTITGQISNIEDAIDSMFNEIGKSSETVINTGLNAVSTIVENWQEVAKVVALVAATYGSYKAALIAVWAVQKVQAIWGTISAFLSLAKSVTTAKDAMLLFNMVSAANPIGVLAAIIGGAATAYMLFKEKTDAASQAQATVNKLHDEAAAKVETEKVKIEDLVEAAKDDTKSMADRNSAIRELNKIIPGYNAKLDETTGKYYENADALKAYLDELERKYILEGAKKQLVSLGEQLGEAAVKAKQAQKALEAAKNAGAGYTYTTSWGQVSNTTNDLVAKRQLEAAQANATVWSLKAQRQSLKDVITEVVNEGNEQKKNVKTTQKEITYQQKRAALQKEYNEAVKAEAKARKSGSDKEWEKAKANLDDVTKRMKEHGQDPTKAAANAKKAATAAAKAENEAAERREKMAEEQESWTKEQIEQAIASQNAIEEARIASMKDGAARERAQAELDHEKRMQQIDAQERDFRQKNYEHNQKEWEASNTNKNLTYADTNAGKAGWKGTAITDDQAAQIDAMRSKEISEWARIEQKQYNLAEAAMNDYLANYGTAMEKRQAIREQYNKKILEADTAGEKMSLQKELEKALSDLDYSELKKSIDWDFVFGNLEDIPVDVLDEVNQKLEKFKETAKDLQPDQLKAIVEAMQNIEARQAVMNPIESMKAARHDYNTARTNREGAQVALRNAKAVGDDEETIKQQQKINKYTNDMVKAKKKERNAWEDTKGAAETYAKGIQEVGEMIGGTTQKCTDLLAGAINLGFGMADSFKKIGEAASAMEKAVAILAIIEAAMKAVQLVMSLFGGEDETLTNYVDTMDTYIDLLSKNIDKLNDSMTSTKNTMKDTIAYYEDLVQLEKDSATAIKSQSYNWLNSGASIGSHSEGYTIKEQINDGLDSGEKSVKEYYQRVYNTLQEYRKKAWGSTGDLGRMEFIWSLSDDDIRKLAADTETLSALGTTLATAVTNYVAALDSIKEADTDKFEALLSLSFDDMYDDFTDMIKDMDNSSASFANNFAEYMRNALVKNMVAAKYKDKLQTLYNQAAQYAEDGTLDSHLDDLRRAYQAYATSANEEVKAIDKMTGYNSNFSQSASSSAWQNMSEDTGEEINGRFTAMVEKLTEAVNLLQAGNLTTSKIAEVSIQTYSVISEMQEMLLISNDYLERIARNSDSLPEIQRNIEKIKNKL